jgi:hypothetical protein
MEETNVKLTLATTRKDMEGIGFKLRLFINSAVEAGRITIKAS